MVAGRDPHETMITWIYYPKSDAPTLMALSVVGAFEALAEGIDCDSHELTSNQVLALLRSGLEGLGFDVEGGTKSNGKIKVPVLFGMNGRLEKSFDADAYHQSGGFVIEVEAGRGVLNNQFLKDLFQACMMHDVSYLAIAVRRTYKGRPDFDRVVRFFDTLYASHRLRLPLKGILVLGY